MHDKSGGARELNILPGIAADESTSPGPAERSSADAAWMRPAFRSRPVRYGVAIGVAALAVAITALLPEVFRGIPFMPAFLAVFLAGWFGGAGASLVTAILTGLCVEFLVSPPAPASGTLGDHLRLLLFFGVAGLFTFLQAQVWATRRGQARFRREADLAHRSAAVAEEQVREILETVSDAFCTLDRDYRFTYLNARAERVLGRRREDVLGKDLRKEYPMESEEMRVLERAMEEQVPGQFEFLFRPTARWISATIYPRPEGVSILFRDSTRQKKVEADLQRLAAIVEFSEDAIVAKSLDGTITAWNAGAQRLFGYTASEVIGKPISILMPEEHKSEMTTILGRIRRGERMEHFETVRLHKDGRHLIVSLSVSPIRDGSGRIIGASKIARNITEQREAEIKIRETQRQLQLALMAARMGTWSWDLSAQKLTLSPMLLEIHGLSAESFHGDYDAFLDRVQEEDRARVDAALRAAVEDGAAFQAEYRVAGEPARWVALHGQMFPGSPGFFDARMIGIGRDITEQKEGEAERERLYAEAQEAIQARDAFLSVAGHEFRTPLGALSLTLHNVTRNLAPASERAAKGLETARRQLERLTHLTEDLLEVGRIKAGRLALEPERTELGEVVEEVVERLDESAKRAGCAIEVHTEARLVGMWDRSRLDQVVTNLLTNAVKFGRGQPIEVTLAAQDRVGSLTVRDHGIGIRPEDQSRIFERFERAVAESSYRGIGLGLWITRQIVEAHGGTITVESEPGKGATFRVQLPGIEERAA